MISPSQEIRAGEQLAKNLKEYFYADESWTPKLAFEIGHLMTRFKRDTEAIYEHLDTIALLQTLAGYSKQDVKDVIQ